LDWKIRHAGGFGIIFDHKMEYAMKSFLFSACMALLLGSISPLQAQDLTKLGIDTSFAVPKGLEVGQKAPDFEGQDQYGQKFSLSSLLNEGPVVLIFYRGDWCPVCNRYLGRFQDSLHLIMSAGGQVLAITPETNDNIQNTLAKTKVGLKVMSDRDEQVMDAYGVKFRVTKGYQNRIKLGLGDDIASNNGQEEANLPVPATYIIGRDGIIRFRQFDLDYRVRASIQDMIGQVQEWNK
jgi:peroxiredoxin